MCTATWLRTPSSYEVFFNRDELATRKPARPPERRDRDGVRILAPEDGDAGGTWIGVNEFGLSVGLANGARGARDTREDRDAREGRDLRDDRDETGRAFRSRGLLVLELLACRSLAEIEARFAASDPSTYRSFSLFGIDRSAAARIWTSDGERIAGRAVDDVGPLLLSSSKDSESARRARLETLERMTRAHGGLDAEVLARFHASHEPERGPLSPCMHREDARTVSFTRIRVGAREAEIEYREGSPCEAGPPIRRSLPLVGP